MTAISSIARRLARLSIFASQRIEKAGRGHDNQGQQQQPPTEHCRPDQAGEHLQRLADQLAEQRIQSAGHLAHVVREAAHQVGGAVLAEGGQVHPQCAAIEELSQIEDGPLRQSRHQQVVGHQKQVLQHGARHQQQGDEEKRVEGIVGQIRLDVRLGDF